MAASSIQHPVSSTTVFLDQPPSCLQFCPGSPDYFVVGTYLLSESKRDDGETEQKKTGSLQLWKVNCTSNELSQVQRLPLPHAVFDLHFHPREPTIFAIATSAGSISLFSVSNSDSTSSQPCIRELWTLSVHEDPSIPALFLAWTPQHWFSSSAMDGFAVTFSDGRTTLFGTTEPLAQEKNTVAELGSFQARQAIEVWFVATAAYSECEDVETIQPCTPYMFTGNDFGSLHTRRFDSCSAEENDEDLSSRLVLDHDDRARHHTAGVTSILPLPVPLQDGAPLILTGSYDESLRLYHASPRGSVLAETCLGGGVWRLQLLRSEKVSASEWMFLVLASCMHAGTRLVRVTRANDEWTMEVMAEFTEHQSMNYASDVWKGNADGSNELVVVSSSFYDKRVCLWRARDQ
ncbi:hypothetical protein ASPZODRAFT_130744 [Penicilliopsis zonata CBS 506.65]|uniref:Anaphase-promoting complex subunit 4 WD40 domain-containing protein n=1 Tax=Penicilliopsis zonata CBS 506.65 TaxID=1073090 RepID=A0A1L9SNL0_9EURO|nr:hypothetical protein ASPZODRAFT_130744 [Penicilliopsis zonata CBS 506.65]OJJ48644.1 hypothetical protein ASPZODRAFT_130744 [Penicilliopsis zonata CBS 506.65]